MKVLHIGISPGFWLTKKANGDSNIFCKFQLHIMQIFFEIATKIFFRWQPPTPVPAIFDGLPYPICRGVPQYFFFKMTANLNFWSNLTWTMLWLKLMIYSSILSSWKQIVSRIKHSTDWHNARLLSTEDK